MTYTIYSLPELNAQEKSILGRLPKTPDHLREFVDVVKKYSNTYQNHVLVLFIWIYVLYISI